MSIFDITIIGVAAFLDGWFLRTLALSAPTAAGRVWARRWLGRTLWLAGGLLGLLCVSWGLNYHSLPPWQTFIVTPCIASAGAALLIHREAVRWR